MHALLPELEISGTMLFASHMLPGEILRKITVDKAPDKLLTCECRECERCGLWPLREDPFENHPGGIPGKVPVQNQGDIVSGIIKNLL